MAKATDEQIAQMSDWASAGMSYVQIAKKLGWTKKGAERSIARYIKIYREQIAEKTVNSKTLDEFTKKERLEFLQEKLLTTPRVRIVFKTLSLDEKLMFEDEYTNILKSTDSLTEAEEQTLFTAVLSYVLAMKALSHKHTEEELYQRSLDGEIKDDDPKYRRRLDDRFQKEYESHMTKYNAMMKDLKMSRSQRLDKIKTERLTLVDVAESLSRKSAQSDAALEIEKLSRLRDDELKKLLMEGHLLGEFDE